MKQILLSLMLAASMTLGPGCATTSTEDGSARAARLAGVAANLGTTVYLSQNPAARPAFEQAYAALSALEANGNFDPAAFAEALSVLPIDELKGPEGQLYISVAIVLYEELKANSIAVNTPEWVKPVLSSVKAGLGRALGK
jgi:hypothetical protein